MLLIVAAGKEPQAYHVQRTTDRQGRSIGYRLTKAGLVNTVYDVEQVELGSERYLVCDCPDATYVDRPGGCKHGKALKAALSVCGL